MPPRTRRPDPYSSRAGRADRGRRRVVKRGRNVGFSNGSNRTGNGWVNAPARPRSVGIRRPRKGRATGVLGALAAVMTVVALIVQTLLMVILAVVGWGLTALVGMIEFRTELADIRRQAKLTNSAPKSRSRTTQTTKRAPATRTGGRPAPKPSSGPSTQKRTRACDRRCQESVKPVKTCKCSCGGSQHGSRKPGI